MTDKQTEQLLKELRQWHSQVLAQLQQISDVGEDTGIIVQGDGGTEVKLTGDIKKGVIMGMHLAIDLIGKFPIKITRNG